MRRSVGILAVATLSTVVLVVSAAPTFAATADHRGAQLAITSVSNPKPSLISGGNVLVRVTGSSRIPKLTVDGRTTGATVHSQPDGSWLALIGGLRNGVHHIDAKSGHESADLRVTNHAITGPVFSGAQQLPFICETQAYGLPAAT